MFLASSCNSSAFPHVCVMDCFTVLYLSRTTFSYLTAMIKYNNVIRDIHHNLHVMLNKKDCFTFFLEGIDNFKKFRDRIRKYAQCWFVEKIKFRISSKGAGKFQKPPLPVREILSKLISLVFQFHNSHQFHCPFSIFLFLIQHGRCSTKCSP